MDVIKNILKRKKCDRCGITRKAIYPTLLGTTNLCEKCAMEEGAELL